MQCGFKSFKIDKTDYTESFVEKQLPAPALHAVIEEYVYRKIVLGSQAVVSKEMPCRHLNSIDFFITGSYGTEFVASGENVPFARCTIRGPRTYRKYRIRISENFASFSIRFKPTGIYQLLGIPMNEFCDESVDATLVKPRLFKTLTERLLSCDNLEQCKNIVEPILIKELENSAFNNGAAHMVEQLAEFIKYGDAAPLSRLYETLPLSPRQLERSFTRHIGVTPKLFSNLIRFEKVMRSRIDRPQDKWTSIAYDFNYFDQMHLVKDFKKFLGITPTAFRPQNFAL